MKTIEDMSRYELTVYLNGQTIKQLKIIADKYNISISSGLKKVDIMDSVYKGIMKQRGYDKSKVVYEENFLKERISLSI